jgi:hypothetical protein
VIKHAFKVLFDNMIPGMHKVFIHHNQFKKKIPDREFSEKLKRLKSTKKAVSELENADKAFYEFFLSLSLTKEQRREFKSKSVELDEISKQYKR